MIILMDKMKDHSCAIQPAFGYGGNIGLNFAFMFDQVFNTDPLISPVEEDEPSDPPIYLPQVDNLFNPANQQQPPLATGPVAAAFQQILATEQAIHNATLTGNNQQPQLSIAEWVANAVQQHIVTHHAPFQGTGTTANESNNSQQPEISVAEMISNAIQESLAMPTPQIPQFIGVSGSQASGIGGIPVLAIPMGGFQQHAAVASQSQANAAGLVTELLAAAVAQPPPQQGAPAYDFYLEHLTNMSMPFPSPTNSNFTGTLNDVHSSISAVPPDEESNSSNPPFHAPVSSPIHLSFSNNFNASDDDEGYAPFVASNIIIIDSAGHSDNVDEN